VAAGEKEPQFALGILQGIDRLSSATEKNPFHLFLANPLLASAHPVHFQTVLWDSYML
jgi:hypothetical protein